MRCRLKGLILALAAGFAPIAALAADGFVQEDRTPVASQPGVGGKILRWLDGGVPLVVLGRDGEWLKVAGAGLGLSAREAWVPAARVGPMPPGERPADEPPVGDFRLQIAGFANLPFRARCLVLVEAGHSRRIALADRTPAELQLAGDAVACTVRNREDFGYLQVTLLDSDGKAIARTETAAPEGAVQVRSEGPWGAAAGFAEPRQFVILRDVPDLGLVPPIGNPVPPLANPVPPMGNPVPPFSNPPVGPVPPMP